MWICMFLVYSAQTDNGQVSTECGELPGSVSQNWSPSGIYLRFPASYLTHIISKQRFACLILTQLKKNYFPFCVLTSLSQHGTKIHPLSTSSHLMLQVTVVVIGQLDISPFPCRWQNFTSWLVSKFFRLSMFLLLYTRGRSWEQHLHIEK